MASIAQKIWTVAATDPVLIGVGVPLVGGLVAAGTAAILGGDDSAPPPAQAQPSLYLGFQAEVPDQPQNLQQDGIWQWYVEDTDRRGYTLIRKILTRLEQLYGTGIHPTTDGIIWQDDTTGATIWWQAYAGRGPETINQGRSLLQQTVQWQYRILR